VEAGEPAPGLLLHPGSYLSETYLETLRASKSPLRAEGQRPINLVIVRDIDGSRRSVMPIYNMHEGGPSFAIAPGGDVSVMEDAGDDTDGLLLRPEPPDRLILGFGRHAPQRFFWTPDRDMLLREIVIAGAYRDPSGRIVRFTTAGQAVTPEGSFGYIVGADHVLLRFDYILDTDRQVVYRLRRNGCRLDLLKVRDWPGDFYGNDGSEAELWRSLLAEDCIGR